MTKVKQEGVMAGRYLITGVQLGMLLATSTDKNQKLLKEIEEKQYVGQSESPIADDILARLPRLATEEELFKVCLSELGVVHNAVLVDTEPIKRLVKALLGKVKAPNCLNCESPFSGPIRTAGKTEEGKE